MPISTLYPLWEHANIKDDEMAGRGYLPDSPTGRREALVTSVITAAPEQIIRLPGPGWVPFTAAVAVATVFAAMTVKLTMLGILAGIVALGALLHWWWTMDAGAPRQLADAGRGLALPLYQNGSGSTGWWGMGVFLVSDAAIVASFLFTYLFLWTARPGPWPPDGSRLPGFVAPTLVAAATIAAYVLFELADRANQRERRGAVRLSLVASALLAAVALALGWMWLAGLGTDPTVHGYGASVWTLLGYMALHVAIGIVMALWCLARLQLGMIDAWRSLTLRLCLLWWRFTAAATVLTLVLVTVFPHVVS